jgi:hypothetical protein
MQWSLRERNLGLQANEQQAEALRPALAFSRLNSPPRTGRTRKFIVLNLPP